MWTLSPFLMLLFRTHLPFIHGQLCHFFGISVQSKNRDFSGIFRMILEKKVQNMTSLMMTSSQYSKNVIQKSPLCYMLNWTFSTWSTTIMWYFVVCAILLPFFCGIWNAKVNLYHGKVRNIHVKLNFLLKFNNRLM